MRRCRETAAAVRVWCARRVFCVCCRITERYERDDITSRSTRVPCNPSAAYWAGLTCDRMCMCASIVRVARSPAQVFEQRRWLYRLITHISPRRRLFIVAVHAQSKLVLALRRGYQSLFHKLLPREFSLAHPWSRIVYPLPLMDGRFPRMRSPNLT